MLRATPKRSDCREPRLRRDVPRLERGYICPNCDLVLVDGVSYEWCPACMASVDQVDLREPVWACPGCDAMVNGARKAAPWCETCERDLLRVHSPSSRMRRERRDKREARASMLERFRNLAFHPRTMTVLYLLSLIPVLLLALDDTLRWSMIGIAGPFIFMPVILAALLLTSIRASWHELAALVRDRRTRVVHGLEHATLGLLERDGAPVSWGLTRNSSFIAAFHATTAGWGDREKKIRKALRRAVSEIQRGNTELAYDRRCGTSFLVGALLLAVLGLLACAAAFLINLSFSGVIGTFLVFAATMAFVTRPLGLAAQRAFTVSHEFRKARLARLVRLPTVDGELRYEVFVEVTG